MKKFALMLVAAATLYSAAPASAQSVSVGPGGIRVDSNDRGYRGDREYRGREYRGRDWRRSRGEYRSRRVIVAPRAYQRRDRSGVVIIQR